MKTVTIEYFGMSGHGPTMKDAKADAGRKLTKAMNAEYTPYQIYLGDTVGLVWRTPHGYCTTVYQGKRGGDLSSCTMHGDCTRGEAMQSMRRHMADVAGIDAEEAKTWFYHDPAGFADWKFKQGFQMAAKHGQSLGIPNSEIHTYACEHAREYVAA